MKWRIHLHWTAGSDGVSAVEADAYHYIVARDGRVYRGDDAIEANIPPLRSGRYAAHTLNANSYAIGVALDAMHGAIERPFRAGSYPITEVQLTSMARLCADLCRQYGIPVERDRVLTHAEVQRTLGIPQKAKWDIMWIPGMSEAGDPIKVGDVLRQKIRAAIVAQEAPSVDPQPGAPTTPAAPPDLSQEIAAMETALAKIKTKLEDLA